MSLFDMDDFILPQRWVEEFEPLPDEWLNYFASNFLKIHNDAEKVIREIAEEFKISEQLLVTLIDLGSSITNNNYKYDEDEILYPCGLKMKKYEGLYSQVLHSAMLFKYYYNNIFFSDSDREEFEDLKKALVRSNYFYSKSHENDSCNLDKLIYNGSKENKSIYIANSMSLNLFRHIVSLYSNRIASLANREFPLSGVISKCFNVMKTADSWFINNEKHEYIKSFDFYIKLLELNSGLMPSEFKNLDLYIELLPSVRSPIIETVNDDCIFFKDNFLKYKSRVADEIKSNFLKYVKEDS